MIESNTNTVNAQENTTTSEELIKFFAIQHAQSGSLSEINETAYSLELIDVSDKTILFSDRPDRIVKSISTSDFSGNWSTGEDSFVIDAPNAVLVIDELEKQEEVVVELFEPVYDYDANILIYNFNYLNNTMDKLPSEFGQSTLIIDASFFKFHQHKDLQINNPENNNSIN